MVSTIISREDDDRPFAKTKAKGVEFIALLDTGPNTNWGGTGAIEFLKERQHKIVKLKD